MTREPSIWAMRAGKHSELDSLFLRRNTLAIGWATLGDLALLDCSPRAFEQRMAVCYPRKSAPAVGTTARQLYRFVCEMRENDIVIYPSKLDRLLYIGRVSGPYCYDPSVDPDYPNHRPVIWTSNASRDGLTATALAEIGSIMTLFQLRSGEFRNLIETKLSGSTVHTRTNETGEPDA
jgi:restriction system protein